MWPPVFIKIDADIRIFAQELRSNHLSTAYPTLNNRNHFADTSIIGYAQELLFMDCNPNHILRRDCRGFGGDQPNPIILF